MRTVVSDRTITSVPLQWPSCRIGTTTRQQGSNQELIHSVRRCVERKFVPAGRLVSAPARPHHFPALGLGLLTNSPPLTGVARAPDREGPQRYEERDPALPDGWRRLRRRRRHGRGGCHTRRRVDPQAPSTGATSAGTSRTGTGRAVGATAPTTWWWRSLMRCSTAPCAARKCLSWATPMGAGQAGPSP